MPTTDSPFRAEGPESALDLCFDICQIRRMSKQPLASVVEAPGLARQFKALGDPTRLGLLMLIAGHDDGSVCVCDLTDAFAVTAPTISHHLKVLREAGLVSAECRGTWIYYRADRAVLSRLSGVLGDQVTASA
jgi:ArsR family transcriptional regulator, arsenate/arsenite/antimonite-responsive transcriptional repressor